MKRGIRAMAIAAVFLSGTFHPGTFRGEGRLQSRRSVMDGVYTEAQASRGERWVYDYGCDRCHGAGLQGGEGETPPLAGSTFTGSWYGRTLGDLHDEVRRMPPDSSRKPSPRRAADVVAYLLWLNWYPVGESELPSRGLDEIEIVPAPR